MKHKITIYDDEIDYLIRAIDFYLSHDKHIGPIEKRLYQYLKKKLEIAKMPFSSRKTSALSWLGWERDRILMLLENTDHPSALKGEGSSSQRR